MPANDRQPGRTPYRLMEQMQIDIPSLVIQEHALLGLMGGPFPEHANDFRAMKRVLDVACGAGGWAIEVARNNPHLEVVGIAGQATLVAHARERAAAAGLSNVRFSLLTGNEKLQLPFPDQEFDLVNTQYLHAWLRENEWSDFARDCWRITRPSGYVRMTEPERGQSTSLAFTHLEDLYLQAMQRVGQRISPDERHIGSATQLTRLFQEIETAEITRRAYITDYGKTGDLPEHALTRLCLYAQTFQPLILQEGLASQEELETLMGQISEEIKHEEFAANRFLITICARKPAEEERAKAQRAPGRKSNIR